MHRIITMHALPTAERQAGRQTDRQTDGQTIARRFVLRTHRALKVTARL